MNGIETVLFPESIRSHILGCRTAHTGGHQLDCGGVSDQLEGVLVSSNDHCCPAGGSILHRDGPDEIVRLPAVQFIHGDIHSRQNLFQQRHLAGQLIWHPLPLGLIALIGQVPEGGGLSVKGNA